MWSSRLFWKLIIAYTILNVGTLVAFVVVITGWQRSQVIEQIDLRLRNTAIVLRSQVADEFSTTDLHPLQKLIEDLGRQTQTRMTLVGMDGVVLADSHKKSSQMNNHKNRPELADAARKGEGHSERVSDTLRMPMKYFALRIDRDDTPIGLVRVAVPVAKVQQRVAEVEQGIWTVAIAAGLIGISLTYWLVAQIIRPLTSVTEAARAIASGRYEHRAQVSQQDELGELAAAFNRLGEEIPSRIQDLQSSGERLSTVLGGMVEGVIAVDSQQRVLFANAAAGRLLGFDSSEANGRLLIEVARNPNLRKSVRDALQNTQPNTLEMDVVGGAGRVLSMNTTPLPGSPCPGVVLVLHDISELRKLESIRQEFVANVSHELKTPLSAIKAYAETLLKGALADPDNNVVFLQRIEEQADRLHELILDLLSLARIETGNESFDIIDVLIDDVVTDCIQDHQATADSANVSLLVDCQVPHLRVRADIEGLREILTNLVGNAIKYTPGGGNVTIRVDRLDPYGLIEVEDTGIGIAEEDQERVFERFFRVDKARSRELGGTGLGLSIVKHLTQSFGGHVGVRSEIGEGAVFWVKIPLSAPGFTQSSLPIGIH